MPLATQKTDTGLSMGLLKILHKQVSSHFKIKMNQISSTIIQFTYFQDQLAEYAFDKKIALIDFMISLRIPKLFFYEKNNLFSFSFHQKVHYHYVKFKINLMIYTFHANNMMILFKLVHLIMMYNGIIFWLLQYQNQQKYVFYIFGMKLNLIFRIRI